jgi:hypothetical protein
MYRKDSLEARVEQGSPNRRGVSKITRVRLSVSLIALTAVFGVMLAILQSKDSASAADNQQTVETSMSGPTGMTPTVITGEQTAIFPQDDATINGTVEGGPGQATADFEYGLSTAYGLTSETQDITIPTVGPLTISAPLTGLSLETTYHFRLAVTQNGITYYGNDRQFTTQGPATPVGLSGEPATGSVSPPAQTPKTPGSTNTGPQSNSPRVALLSAMWRHGQLVVTIRCLGTTSQRCRGSGVLTAKKHPGSRPLAIARIRASVTGGHTVHIVAKPLTSSAKFHSMDTHTLALTFSMKQ